MKKASVISLLVFILLYVSPVTFWLYAQKIENKLSNQLPQIKYKGEIDNSLVFDIIIPEVHEKAILSISNEDGDVLYEEKISGKQFQKRFKIVPMGLKEIHFDLVKNGSHSKEIFKLERKFEEKLFVYRHK